MYNFSFKKLVLLVSFITLNLNAGDLGLNFKNPNMEYRKKVLNAALVVKNNLDQKIALNSKLLKFLNENSDLSKMPIELQEEQAKLLEKTEADISELMIMLKPYVLEEVSGQEIVNTILGREFELKYIEDAKFKDTVISNYDALKKVFINVVDNNRSEAIKKY